MGVCFMNPVSVQAAPSREGYRKVSVVEALVNLVRSALTEPESLVVEEEKSKFVCIGSRGGKISAHCVALGEQPSRPGAADILLLHGVLGSTFSFRRVQYDLAKIFGGQTVAFDRPPYGLTSRPRPLPWALNGCNVNPYSLDFGVEMSVSVMESFRMDNVVLVGHSMGAAVAIRTALNNPDKVPVVASILFFLAMGKNATCPFFFAKAMERYFFDISKVNIDELFVGYTRPMRHAGWVRAAIATARAMRDYDCTEDARKLDIPILIIQATHDKVVSDSEVDRLKQCVPHAQCRVIENCGHNPHEEQPEKVLKIIREWSEQENICDHA